MGRTPAIRGSFVPRRTPISSGTNGRSSHNSSAKKSNGKMEEEMTKVVNKQSDMFDSSDDDDDMAGMMVKNLDQKQQHKDATKVEVKQNVPDEEKLNFEIGDFVAETNERIENKYYFMKPPLGVGLFGTVFKARHKESGQIRAIKKIRKDHQKAKDVENLLKDVEILKKLDHPNIVKVYEFYQDEANYYIVTDYCSGGELFDRIIQEKNFNEIRAAEMMKYILSGIAYCHEKGLVHCDLKPENILLASSDPDETLMKIIDFGNSSFCKPGDRLKSKFGSVYYVAPEVLQSSYNEKCDVWSLGVILFLLLCGKPPFNGNNDQDILTKVYVGSYSMEGPEWANISVEAKDLISKMLIKDFSLRISAKDALNHCWFVNNTKEKVLRLDIPIGRRSLRNLKDFRSATKLQEAILYFLVNQLTSKEEMQDLLDQFLSIDSDGDGKLTREDLLKAYAKSGKDPVEAEEIVDTIIKNSDKNSSGFINYSEFITASISKRKFFSEDRLTMAFKLFDTDNKNYIGVTELKNIFNAGVFQNIDEGIWESLIDSVVGKAPEGEEARIDFETFKSMMRKFTENEHITQSIRMD